MSIFNATSSMETFVVNDILKQKAKLENELSLKIIIVEDKRKMAFIGEALWRDVDEEFKMLVIELQRVA